MSDYVDLHIHGAFGVDITTADPAGLDRLAIGLRRAGYAAFLPTLVPMPHARLLAAIERLREWLATADPAGATPLGIHFEGPFVARDRGGALHPDCFLDLSDRAGVDRFFGAIDGLAGRNMVTLAPEITGGLEIIQEFRRRRFLIAVGHTSATSSDLESAVLAGARHMTHFCNAMRPLHHREPGPIGFGLTSDAMSLDLIADMHHLHPRMIELVLRARSHDAVALISDAIPAAGLAEGDYQVWGETLRVHDGEARNAAGSLAGSVALLGDCVRRLVAKGLMDETRAQAAASTVPMAILDRACGTTTRFVLYRQDDHGNCQEIETFADAERAAARQREFESLGHRQTYRVERITGAQPGLPNRL